jgi:class 3 adenylate cyclase/tetratricopeptide (TPR) repeat protein
MPKEEASTKGTRGTKFWLEEIGLAQYAEMFSQNRIDLDILPDVTEADLVELGVPLGDRKRLLRAVAALARGRTEIDSTSRSVGRAKGMAAAERRQLTVMFCDMVGSTALSERFDPEDVRDMIAAYRECCARVVERYHGYVARYIGDGILVYFGYPNAHEDDAERAVRTGLEIARTFSTPSPESSSPLGAAAVRIGIATGLVVVGDLSGESTAEHDSAVGETPNLAARLQALAPPNGVVIGSSTQSLLRAKFEYEDLGSQALKGISAPVQAWRVIRPSRIETRFAATFDSRSTPLVNRTEELVLLLARWQQSKERHGQVVTLSGEPGIGKSRIVQEFRERIAGEPHRQVSFQCSPYYTGTAFHPFVEQLKSTIFVDREGASDSSLTSLETVLADTVDESELVAPLFAALLSIAPGDRYGPLELAPQRQKEATVSALVDHFAGLGRKQPAVMIFEDAQWIDPTSQEVLDLLTDRVRDASVLLVITCRPEFQPGWEARSHMTTLMLNRLSPSSRAVLVERVAEGKALAEEVVEEIIAKTDGVPLFMEELTKAVLESNLLSVRDGRYVFSRELRQLAIPATLTDSLMARLDRMASFKEVAQIGATIGREFSYELLRAVAEIPPDRLDVALSHLEQAGLIVRGGHPPHVTYAFKHALVQDAAHSSLLRSDRKKLHARIAAVIAELYPQKAEREPELLAHHLTEAKQSKAAVDFWLKAGKRAAKTRANLEAIAHLRRGIEVLEGDPEMPDRDRTELALRIELGLALIAARGYAVKEVEENYLRALELGRKLEDGQRVFGATRGLWVCHFIRADMVKAHDLATHMLNMAQQTHGSGAAGTGYLIEAHRALGMTMFWDGRFVASRDHLERCIGLYEPGLHRSLKETYGIDPGIVSSMYLAYLLWFLGRPDDARELSERTLSNAQRMRHPFTLAFALAFRTYLSQHLRDLEDTWDHASRTLAVCSDHGIVFYKQQATMLRGWALAELGDFEDGLRHIRAGLDAYEAMESGLASPWFRSLLASAYRRAGRPDAALRALDDALTIIERTGERSHLAEIHRLQGEIMYAHHGSKAADETEARYLRALEVCRQQEALAWELRTSVSLARLWRDVGKRREAAGLLGSICRRFTQGFDTPDLAEALQTATELDGTPISGGSAE